MTISLASNYTINVKEAVTGLLLDRVLEDGEEISHVYMAADDKFCEKWEKVMKLAAWAGEDEAPDFQSFLGEIAVGFEKSDDTGGVNIWYDAQYSYGWIIPIDGYPFPGGYEEHPDDLEIDDDDGLLWIRGEGYEVPEGLDLEDVKATVQAGRDLVEEITEWICTQVSEYINEAASKIAKKAEELAEWKSTDDAPSPFAYEEHLGWTYNGEDAKEYDEVIVLSRNWQRTVQEPYEQYRVSEYTLEAHGIFFN